MPKVKSLNHVLKMNAKPKPREPVWKGPEVDGITYSLLCRFLSCRERFRLRVVEGLKAVERWNHRTGYGDLWHACEEHWVKTGKVDPSAAMRSIAKAACTKYPSQQQEVIHWAEVCKAQFPLYVKHWSKHPDMQSKEPVCQEQEFNVAYQLPSGRVVKLRGKFDSVDLAGKGKERGVWLQENKTKGDVDEQSLKRQLTFDLQTMIYLSALEQLQENLDGPFARFLGPIKGVRYNVVRRPLSGGKGTIKQLKEKVSKKGKITPGESKADYYKRLSAIIEESADEYFIRFNVGVTKGDIQTFQQRCLDPILEQLCDWWGWIARANLLGRQGFEADHDGSNPNTTHWQFPYGVFNPLTEGYSTEYDDYMMTGSLNGLQRTGELFPELGASNA